MKWFIEGLLALWRLITGRDEHFVRFGPHLIHRRYATEHFSIFGSTGSGKTQMMKEMMRSVLRSTLFFRGLIYDPKVELVPTLFERTGTTEEDVIDGTSKVKILNPFDLRSSAWEIGKDFSTLVHFKQLARDMVEVAAQPSSDGSDSFFRAASEVQIAVTCQLLASVVPNKGAWELRDLILALSHRPYLDALVSIAQKQDSACLPVVERMLEAYVDCGDARTAANIRATLLTHLSAFEVIAATWHAARLEGRTFSLTEWASDDGQDILVLGNDEAARASVDAVNGILFKRMSELILSRRELSKSERETGSNQTWIWLDEAREAGNLRGLNSLLLKGRSKGVAVVLSAQDIDGWRDAYSDHVANEILAQCNNAAFLRIVGETTAKWAAESFGSSIHQSKGSSISLGENASFGHNTGEDVRTLVHSADFMFIEPAGSKNGISGYYRLAGHTPRSKREAFGNFMPEDFRRKTRPAIVEEDSPWLSALMPRPAEDQYLKPWDSSDWQRLGFSGEPPSWRSAATKNEQTVSEMMQEYLDSERREDTGDGRDPI